MTTSYGFTSAGLVVPSMQDVLNDINSDQRNLIDPNIDQNPDNPLGQLNTIFAERETALWEVLATVVGMLDPKTAEARMLDNACALSGTKREAAYPSNVVLSLTLAANVTVPAGSIVSVLGNPSAKFVLVGPPGASGSPIVSTTAGQYSGTFNSMDNGPVVANAGTLTVIETPVAGWSAVTNGVDATLGSLQEDDPTLRQRRIVELDSGGSGTDAVKDGLVSLGLVDVEVYENTGDLPDAYNRPPHSIEAVVLSTSTNGVYDISDSAIAQTIWDYKPGGAQTIGTSVAVAYDDNGAPVYVYFTRTQQVVVGITVTISKDSDFPSAGTSLVQAAIAALPFTSGQNVVATQIAKACLSVAGVYDVPFVSMQYYTGGFSPSQFYGASTPVSKLTIGANQIAVLSTTHVLVQFG